MYIKSKFFANLYINRMKIIEMREKLLTKFQENSLELYSV